MFWEIPTKSPKIDPEPFQGVGLPRLTGGMPKPLLQKTFQTVLQEDLSRREK